MADKTRPEVIAFDLDGTLAVRQEPFSPYTVGEPVEAILDLALEAIQAGKRTLCFTARANSKDPKVLGAVRKWLDDHGLEKMKITNIKTPAITKFYDDRAVGVVPDKGELLTKVAAEMVRKTRMVEVQDDHCPHCDHKFTEKGYPRPDFEQAEREGIDPMDADQLCPNCKGVVDDPEMSDERIDNYQGFGGEDMKRILREQRERKRTIKANRAAKQASTSPENVSVPGRGEEKQAAQDTSRGAFRAALNEAVAAGEVAPDIPFYVSGDKCLVNAGDWHEKEQIAAAMTLARRHFKEVIEENECGLPAGFIPMSANQKSRDAARALEKEATGDKLRNLWIRRGQCPECGGKPKDFEFLETNSNAECRDCGHSFDVDAERKKQASFADAVPLSAFLPTGWREGDPVPAEVKAQWEAEKKRVRDYESGKDLGLPEPDPDVTKLAAMQVAAQIKSASVQVQNRTGPHGILEALKALNLDDLEKQAKADIASGKITKRDRGVKMLNALEGLRRNEIRPEELMVKRVPVLPPAFRPFSFLGATYIPGDANELYQDLFKHRAVHEETLKTLGEGGAALTRMNLLNATRALYGYGEPVSPKLKERGPKGYLDQLLNDGPKHSYVQRRMLSKPIDNVGRSVITVDPDLGLDEVSIPREMAWTLAGSKVHRRLALMGMSAAEAIKAVKDRDAYATRALELEIKENPVLVSRAPAWHKFNAVGQFVKLHDGPHIAINPYITAGQGADFDGDECINQLFACILDRDLPMWEMSYPNLRNHLVRFPQGASSIPVLAESSLFLFDMEDFPHGELQRTKEGAKGRIDFHCVDRPIFVLAHDSAAHQLQWAQVAFWSKHYAREIEIVDTHNNYQIITDDDPRAVYGTEAGKLDMQRFTPSQALDFKVLVPRAKHVPAPDCTVEAVPGAGHNTDPRSTRMVETVALTPEVGWILGAMCGDGWVRQDKGRVVGFAFADNEGFNIAELCRLLPRLTADNIVLGFHAVKSTSDEAGRHGDTTSYRFSATNFGHWFRDLMGGERDASTSGSGNKHLPPFYLAAPEAFRSALLCGLIDTDGSISQSNGKSTAQLMVSFGSTSIRLVQETKLLAASLGISGRITPSHTPLGKPCWMLSFCNHEFQKWGAPYMVHEVKRQALRTMPFIQPSAVTAKYDIVPVARSLALELTKLIGCPKIPKEARKGEMTQELLAKKQAQNLYSTFLQAGDRKRDKFGAVSRQVACDVIQHLGRDAIQALAGGTQWLQVVENADVTWERVTAVQKTGIKEDGYDLTVPGFETFMAADGIILSNTINVSMPVLPESVQEVKDKLMASKMLFSIKDPDAVVPLPKHEQILGIWTAAKRPSTKVHSFASGEEALASIRRGDVKLEDEIEIPDV